MENDVKNVKENLESVAEKLIRVQSRLTKEVDEFLAFLEIGEDYIKNTAYKMRTNEACNAGFNLVHYFKTLKEKCEGLREIVEEGENL